MKNIIEAAGLLSIAFEGTDVARLARVNQSALWGIICDTLGGHSFDKVKKMMRRGLESGVYAELADKGRGDNNLKAQIFTLTEQELFTEAVARQIIAVFLLSLEHSEDNIEAAKGFVKNGEWRAETEKASAPPKASSKPSACGYGVFDKCIIGGSRVKEGKACRDYSCSYSDGQMCIGVVADGHTGRDHFRSDRGAQLVARVAISVLKEATGVMLNRMDATERKCLFSKHGRESGRSPTAGCLFDSIKLSIVKGWRASVDLDVKEHPFTEEELSEVNKRFLDRFNNDGIYYWAYGTTLVASVVTKDFWYAIQVGSGTCVALYREGEKGGLNSFLEEMPQAPFVSEGDAIFSMYQENVLEGFRHYASFTKPVMVLVHSDGIDDSLLDEATRQIVYFKVGGSFAKGIDWAQENIEKGILTEIANNWKGDDTSMAVTYIATEELETVAKALYEMARGKQSLDNYNRAKARADELERLIKGISESVEEQSETIAERRRRFKELNERFLLAGKEIDELEARIEALKELRTSLEAEGEQVKAGGLETERLKKSNEALLEGMQKELDEIRERIAEYEEKHGIEQEKGGSMLDDLRKKVREFFRKASDSKGDRG